MTAASKEQTWPQANSSHHFLGRTEFHFLEDRTPEYKCLGNCGKSDDPDCASSSSLVTYSLSDISLSSSSSSSGTGVSAAGSDVSHKTSSDLMFLPPSKTRHDKLVEGHSWGNETEKSLTYFPDCGSLSHCFPFNDEKTDDLGSSFVCQSSSSHSQTSESVNFEFDVAGMREKLEAQKEYLLGSFNRQTCLPQALTTQPKYPRVEKPSSLKMKEKLHKVGRAARRFLSTRIFRRHPAVQRCEINLQGFDDTDSVERLILVVGQRRSVAETVHMSFPAFFETNRVTVPQFLLPIKSGETMTVSVYGVTGQASGQFPGFSEVLISGVCTVQSDTALLTGNLELQPHRPSHSLTGHNKGIQSCGSSLKTKHTHPDNYTFSTLPKPISKDFTELCVLQTAEPFREYFSLSTSTCDQPASFQAHLLPGTYHAACSFRLTHAPISGTYSLALATPTIFFKAWSDCQVSHFHSWPDSFPQSHLTMSWSSGNENVLMDFSCSVRGDMERAGVAGRLQAATELVQCHVGSVHGSAPQLLPSMQLLKPPGFDLEVLMKSLQTGKLSAVKPTDASQGTTEEGLHLCAWDMGTVMTSHHDATANTTTKSRFAVVNMGTVMTNPRLPSGNRECIPLPSLSVFNLGTQLYFADCWSYYDKHYVTLVLCSKGSPCQWVCKRYLCKLDPYNNPFLFRKRCFDPEPSIAVYASSRINVEVIYSNSAEIQQLISVCSENVYFCKVRMANK